MFKKNAIRRFVINSGLYKPTMFLRRHFIRRYEIGRTKQAIAFFSGVLKPDDLVLDIGANIGQSAEIFLKCGARVVSVEPQSHCSSELRVRFAGNSNFTLISKAIGRAPGSATLYISDLDFMSSFDKEWCNLKWSRTQEVPIITLDAMIAEFGIPKFIKIDVEGWEIEVFNGLTQPVPLLCFEYHSGEKGFNAVQLCLDRLETVGKLKLNLSGQEHWEFSLREWIDKQSLLAELQKRMQSDPDSYGDVWVAMS